MPTPRSKDQFTLFKGLNVILFQKKPNCKKLGSNDERNVLEIEFVLVAHKHKWNTKRWEEESFLFCIHFLTNVHIYNSESYLLFISKRAEMLHYVKSLNSFLLFINLGTIEVFVHISANY